MFKKKYIVLALLLVLVLSACQGGSQAKESILRVGWASEPDTMNPLTSYSSEAVEIFQLVYDKLLNYDLELNTKPGLAESFEYSDDGTLLTFTLRENAKWHDGQPVTAEDVAFTYQLIKENGFGEYAQWLDHMESITAVDDKTVELTFDIPQAFNPGLAIYILPKHIWEGMSADDIEKFSNDEMVGSGPYRFVEWQNGSSLTLEKNADFWGDAPKADKITFILFGNEDVMAQSLKSGDVDILTEVSPTVWDGLKTADNVKVVSLESYSFHHIGINVSQDENSNGNPMLLDKVVRQALSCALDRGQLVELVLAGHGRIGDSIIPIGITGWYHAMPEDQQLNANPEKAKAMLEEAGYVDTDGDGIREDANGNPMEFRLIAIQTTSVDVRAAQLFKDAAEEVGIALELQTLDENTLGNIVYDTEAQDWDIFIWGWDSSVPDPNYMLSVPLCNQIGGNNDIFYCNPEYDVLYEQQVSTIDVAARKEIVDQMQTMFYDDSAYIVMWYQDKLQAYNTSTWQGWTEIPGGIIYNVTRDNYLNAEPVQ